MTYNVLSNQLIPVILIFSDIYLESGQNLNFKIILYLNFTLLCRTNRTKISELPTQVVLVSMVSVITLLTLKFY